MPPPFCVPLHRLARKLLPLLMVGTVAVSCRLADGGGEAEAVRVDEIARVGAEDGAGGAAFGAIGDVAVDGRGNVFVLDVMERRVSLVDQKGAVRSTFGRRGYGPGEFEEPIGLGLDGNGRLLVLDRANQRMELLREAGGRLERTGSFALAFPAEDFCLLGGRLFLLGEHGGKLIHEADLADGHVLRSFAPNPGAGEPLLHTYNSSGYLACGPGDEVTFVPRLQAQVRRFAPSTGAPLGAAVIPGYRQVVVRRLEGGVRFEAPGGKPHDYVASVVPLPGGGRLIQVGALPRGATSRYDFPAVSSFVQGADGRVRPLPDTLPRVLSVRGDTAFAVATEPHPSLLVLKVGLHADNRTVH